MSRLDWSAPSPRRPVRHVPASQGWASHPSPGPEPAPAPRHVGGWRAPRPTAVTAPAPLRTPQRTPPAGPGGHAAQARFALQEVDEALVVAAGHARPSRQRGVARDLPVEIKVVVESYELDFALRDGGAQLDIGS